MRGAVLPLALCACIDSTDRRADSGLPEASVRAVERFRGSDYAPRFGVFHDDARGVTCWVVYGVKDDAVSCLPDSLLKQPVRSTP